MDAKIKLHGSPIKVIVAPRLGGNTMKTGLHENPCPEDSETHADCVLAALDSLHEPTMQAYAEFCEDKIEVPAALAKALILSICSGKWDAMRSRIGYSNEWLDEALNEIVWSIDKQQAAFIEHHAAQLRSKAEQIEQERAA